MSKLDIAAVKRAALNQIDSVLSHYVPEGKYQGAEYVARNPTRNDQKLGSFSINRNTGVWQDFAEDKQPGVKYDVIGLVAYVTGTSQINAAKELARFLGMDNGQPPKTTQAKPPAKRVDEWTPVLPVPDEMLNKCPVSHSKLGMPVKSWDYLDQQGRLLLRLFRFEKMINGEKQKEFRPLTCCQNTKGEYQWRWMAPKDKRPIYGLERLAANTAATVVLVEGEKAADAARVLLPEPEYIAVTWLNGSKSTSKADFNPLAGRKVIIWPDNDQAGQKCTEELTAILKRTGVSGIDTVNLSSLAVTPTIDKSGNPSFSGPQHWPDKADAADALEMGWTAAHLTSLIESGALLVECYSKTDTPPSTSLKDIECEMPPGFRLQGDHIEARIKSDESGNEQWRPICSRLDVLAMTNDANGSDQNWGKLVRFWDYDNKEKTWIIPMRIFATDGGVKIREGLLDRGFRLEADRDAGRRVLQYLHSSEPLKRVGLVSKLGWHGRAFVLPDKTMGEGSRLLMFENEGAPPSKLSTSGTLDEWRDNVASYCKGNDIPMLAVCIAFAGPLVGLMGMSENIGFHFYGDSSLGKSTLLNIACSVYGDPDQYRGSWRQTDNAMEGTAQVHSDMFLALDEMNQVDPRIIDNVVYMLGNGRGKSRAGLDYKNQSGARWRLSFISNGEKTLEQYLTEVGKTVTGGMEMRFLSLFASPHEDEAKRKNLGIFHQPHGHAGGAELSDSLRKNMAMYHGTAFEAFITKLVGQDLESLARDLWNCMAEFKHNQLSQEAGGQVARAADKFALVGLAGEVATSWGLTGWTDGEAMKAATNQFKAWLERRGGTGNIEELQIIEHVREQISLYGDKYFRRWDRKTPNTNDSVIDDHVPAKLEQWGFREPIIDNSPSADSKSSDYIYYVQKQAFERHLCKGFDHKRVARILRTKGILKLRPSELNENRLCTKEKLPGFGNKTQQVYKFSASDLFGDEPVNKGASQ
jgi:putative DNA primase/helicase